MRLVLLASAVLGIGGALEPAGTAAADDAPATTPSAAETRRIAFTTTEGTQISLDVSPDGQQIVFDLLGDIYLLPISGGNARLLVGGHGWDEMPRFTPDGSHIRFVRDRNAASAGTHWQVALVGTPVTGPVADEAPPNLRAGMRFDRAAGISEYRVERSPSGRLTALFRFGPGSSRAELRVRSADGGPERVLMRDVVAPDPLRIANAISSADMDRARYAFTPREDALVVGLAGGLWRIPLEGGVSRRIPFRAQVSQQIVAPLRTPRHAISAGASMRVRGIRAVSASPDRRLLAFSALGHIWVRDGQRPPRRLTDSADIEDGAAISPDGRWLAFLSFVDRDQADGGQPAARARLMLVDLVDWRRGVVRPRQLTELAQDFDPPTWSPDGRSILLGCPTGRSNAIGEQPYSFCTVDMAIGTLRVIAPAPARHIRHGRDPVAPRISQRDRRVYFLEEHRLNRYPDQFERTDVVSVTPDGSDRHVHLTIDSDIAVASFSPGAHRLLVGDRFASGAYLLHIPPRDEPSARVSLASQSVQRLSDRPIGYASWRSDDDVLFGIGPAMLSWSAGGQALRAQELDLVMARAIPSGRLAIINARLVTMQGAQGQERVVDRGTIVVVDGRILALGPAGEVSVPDSTQVIDGTGLTIIPGLIDVHYHRMHREPFSFINRSDGLRALTDADAIGALAFGVTSIFDPSTGISPEAADLEWQEMVEAGLIVAPRYFFSGHSLTPMDYPVATLGQARQIARSFSLQGVSLLKEYIQLERPGWQRLRQAAAENGLGITAHLEDLTQTLQHVADGYGALEHSQFLLPAYDDVVQFIARSGINFTPTINTSGAAGEDGSKIHFESFVREHPEMMPRLGRLSWPYNLALHRLPAGAAGRAFDQSDAFFAARLAASVANAGGTVSIGAHNGPGLFTHFEMWSLHDGGTSPMNALRAATVNGALKLGIEDQVGSLAPGMLADFLALDANPLDDIRSSLSIRYVVASGRLYEAERMTELWPERRAMGCMAWRSEQQCLGD